MNSSVSPSVSPLQSVSLPGRRSFLALVAVLRFTSRSALRLRRSSIRSITAPSRAFAALHVVGEEVVEMVAHRGLDHARGLG